MTMRTLIILALLIPPQVAPKPATTPAWATGLTKTVGVFTVEEGVLVFVSARLESEETLAARAKAAGVSPSTLQRKGEGFTVYEIWQSPGLNTLIARVTSVGSSVPGDAAFSVITRYVADGFSSPDLLSVRTETSYSDNKDAAANERLKTLVEALQHGSGQR